MALLKSHTAAPVHDAPEIPDKLYFRIGEVARLASVKQYVLRYWETEFPSLQPKKSGTNHRLYRRRDVELVLEIKRLLYDKRFTIEGARNYLSAKGAEASAAAKAAKGAKLRTASGKGASQTSLFQPPSEALGQIRRELQAILEMLK